jgi:hypothetical protein
MESQHSIPSVESSGPVQACNGIALPLPLRLYADTCSDVSDDSDNEILDSDTDGPTTGLNKKLPLCAVVFLVTVKQARKRKKVVKWRALMIKQVTCGVKLIKKIKQCAFPCIHQSEYSN